MDFGEGFGEVGRWRFGGDQGLAAGLDGDGAAAAYGAYEFLDAPAGLVLDPVADGQGCEHDVQVSLDGFAFVVVDRSGLQVVFGHAEALLDAPQLVVGVEQSGDGEAVPQVVVMQRSYLGSRDRRP